METAGNTVNEIVPPAMKTSSLSKLGGSVGSDVDDEIN